ncbi:class I SAM-dependent methyltransferase [Microvirga arsenatis]|uniref:Methyltransferase domain-containing protein n=1 Tax=Microvirga arsenatis TaxID=2692265 RepID=A0ABW9YZ98_9HYPH|nr:class I SAM-dependent methyltransferase [Microvirga arsenatis]NBJ11438.1 methyltransferase domain-containing protein [Microvirga arsenatis]NBJ25711.1 methyltransferase domain-containing protein [Microvirga arsenatis]
MECSICSNQMEPDVLEQTFRCTRCGFFSSTLPVTINSGSRIDERVREQGLKPVRLANFKELLDACSDVAPKGTLLDVGCAHGWFIQAAEARGYKGVGIEPDSSMAALSRKAGIHVIEGYFPEALPDGARYDVITFNDVFEHLPDVNKMAQSIRERLTPSGVVIINLPVTDGTIFRLSRMAAQLGMKGSLARMWQQGLPSPHLSYFSTENLPRLMERHGFRLVKSGPLTSIITNGLYERIRADRNISIPKTLPVYAAARAIALSSRFFTSDVWYFAFRPI